MNHNKLVVQPLAADAVFIALGSGKLLEPMPFATGPVAYPLEPLSRPMEVIRESALPLEVASAKAGGAGAYWNTPSGATQNIAPRVFQSSDPIVGELATAIEKLYPGHVVDVNVPLYNDVGKLVTDADILLQNAIIQVKTGGGKSLANQLFRTQQVTDLPVLGYGPTLKGSVVTQVQREGGYVTTNVSTLLEVIKPDK
jgi:hypothetical protein